MKNRKEWLKLRKDGIGGSEISAVLGRNPWRNAYDVYLEKTSSIDMDSEPNGHMKRGTFLEPLVKKMYYKETGHRSVYGKVKLNAEVLLQEPFLIRSLEHPWMQGSPDDLIAADDREDPGILECKCPGMAAYSKILREGFAPYVVDQCQYYMAISGLSWGAIAAFSAEHWELTYKIVEADPDLWEEMIEEGREFWLNNVVKKRPPIMDFDKPPETTAAGTVVKVNDSPTWVHAVTQYREAVALEAEAKLAKGLATQRLKTIMGDAECVEGNGIRFHHKLNQPRESIDTKRLKTEYPDVYQAVRKFGKPYKTFKAYDRGESL